MTIKSPKNDRSTRMTPLRPVKRLRIECCGGGALTGVDDRFSGGMFNQRHSSFSPLSKLRRVLLKADSDVETLLAALEAMQSELEFAITGNIEIDELQSVHGLLLLQIGFQWSSLKNPRSDESDKHHLIVCSLLKFLRVIYQQTERLPLMSTLCLENLEVGETVQLLQTIILDLYSLITHNKADSLPENKETLNLCYVLLEELIQLPRVTHISSENPSKSARLILSLLVCSRFQSLSQESWEDQLNSLFVSLQNSIENDCSLRHQIELLRKLLLKEETIDEVKGLPPPDRLFVWQSMAIIGDTTMNLATHAATEIMLLGMQPNHGHLELAIDLSSCLGFYTPLISRDCARELLDQLCNQLGTVHPAGSHPQKQQHNLMQMQILEAIMVRADGPQLLLQNKGSKEVIHKLAVIATGSTHPGLAKTAAGILITVVECSFSKKEHAMPLDMSMKIVTRLVSTHTLSIAESAICLVYQVVVVTTQNKRPLSDSCIQSCIKSLASVSSSKGEFLSTQAKEKLVESFITMMQDTKPKHALASEPVILEFLVELVAGTTTVLSSSVFNNNIRRVQTSAVKIVLELAQNPCLCRILAKTPGLVPSLIRYTRSEPLVVAGEHHQHAEQHHPMSREELKRQILLLAAAL